jgi:hypothetical protein
MAMKIEAENMVAVLTSPCMTQDVSDFLEVDNDAQTLSDVVDFNSLESLPTTDNPRQRNQRNGTMVAWFTGKTSDRESFSRRVL